MSALDLVRRSVSSATWRSYEQVWLEWEALLASSGLGSQDYETVLLFFIGNAFSQGRSVHLMARKLSALAFWFKGNCLADVTKSFLVRQAMRGFRKGAYKRDTRRPVSFTLLLSLGGKLLEFCRNGFEVILFRLAFSLAFFGAFRVSELVSPSKRSVGGLLLHQLPGSDVCPVRCFQAFVAVRPGGPPPLLVHEDGSFLSKYQFVQVFRQCIRGLGREYMQFSSHSFRIGAATEASRWGLPAEMVKKIGRWESARYRLYVRPHLLS